MLGVRSEEFVIVSIHIIGQKSERLDAITLQCYRVLKTVDKVFLLSDVDAWYKELILEGIVAEVIDKTSDLINVKLICNRLGKNTINAKKIALIVPSYFVPESNFVREIAKILSKQYEINTDFLSTGGELERLTSIMAELRSQYGCPWDKEQSHNSLKKYLIEETYEVIEEIDANNMHNLCEELGDLLLQVVFHSRIAEESGEFDLQEVIEGISEKLIRRHPHVFGSEIVNSSQDVLVNWDVIKKEEKIKKSGNKAENPNDFFNIPKVLPALMVAEKTQKKAAKIGFDWKSYEGPLAKIYEELDELKDAIKTNNGIKEELGDLLFSVVNISRFVNEEPEEALRFTINKFQKRFIEMLETIKSDNLKYQELNLEDMDIYWEKVKNREKQDDSGYIF
ncbi:MAG: nucleoside triphosphate pyrophosphohydrolase [Eubacteriales bacterium]